MPKVSVIVPVYNPGSHIDACIESLVGQTLPASDYEVLFVDDGSTDGTGERLDALAAEHAHVQVDHIPNSGWPGRPRNVGLERARGEYVFFADNDDWLTEDALERLLAHAARTGADVVVGKVVGHGRPLPRALFARSRDDVSIDWPPLLSLLTPHKLFRRALLDAHGIRYPEGRRRLEDHPFVVHAYLHAERIAVLADRPVYHWAFRDPARNASGDLFDPVAYFENVREVLDLVCEHVEPGERRERLLAHWYRSKLLRRMGGPRFVYRHDHHEDYGRAMHAEVARLAHERYGEDVHRHLPWALRLRSRLVLDGTYEQLLALARTESSVRARVRVTRVRARGRGFGLKLETTVSGLEFRADGERTTWVPPRPLRDAFGPADLDVTDELPGARVRALLRRPADGAEYLQPTRSRPRVEDGALAFSGRTRLRPRRAAAGKRLPAGEWELHAQVSVPGAAVDAPVAHAGAAPVVVRWDGRSRATLARASLSVRLQHRFPRTTARLRWRLR